MKKHLHDIETFWEHFELSVQDYTTGESLDFQINQWKDQRKELKEYLRTFSGFSISFNGKFYDFIVLAYLDQNNYFLNESVETFCQKAKIFSDQLINSEDALFAYKYVNYKNFKFILIDLFLYWAKLLRRSKKISLKGLGIQLNYPVVQELPFPPDYKGLTKADVDEIHHYCSVHDLGILKLLTAKMEGEIQLRQQIKKDYSIECWAMDAPKIASEALLNYYSNKIQQDKKSVSKLRFERNNFIFKDLFKDIDFNFQTELFKSIFTEWCLSKNTFSKEFVVGDNHPLKLSIGQGGIHSLNDCEIYRTEGDYVIKTSDVALKVAQVKLLKLTGISLEINLLNYNSNIIMAKVTIWV